MRTSSLARLVPAIEVIGQRWASVDACWLIGGSTGLLLQGVALETEPRDLDIYTDRASVEALYRPLFDYATDLPLYSETPMYGSNLSHYGICGVQVELVGSLVVDRGTAHYEVECSAVMEPFATILPVGKVSVRVMPLAHELLFNVLRERPDRYGPIAEVIRRQPDSHRLVWQRLIAHNRIGEPYLSTLKGLVPELFQVGDPDVI